MNLTRWIIVSTVVIVLAIDSVLALKFGSAGTISVTLTEWGKERPVIPFAFGFLMGHFWAQNKKN